MLTGSFDGLCVFGCYLGHFENKNNLINQVFFLLSGKQPCQYAYFGNQLYFVILLPLKMMCSLASWDGQSCSLTSGKETKY